MRTNLPSILSPVSGFQRVGGGKLGRHAVTPPGQYCGAPCLYAAAGHRSLTHRHPTLYTFTMNMHGAAGMAHELIVAYFTGLSERGKEAWRAIHI